MTDPVSGSTGAPPIPMSDLPVPSKPGFMPDLGSEMLSGIERMQESYQAKAAQLDGVEDASKTLEPGPATQSLSEPDPLMAAVNGLEHSMRMQAELTQFVMLSSVTSAFGRNLNTFLRGQ